MKKVIKFIRFGSETRWIVCTSRNPLRKCDCMRDCNPMIDRFSVRVRKIRKPTVRKPIPKHYWLI